MTYTFKCIHCGKVVDIDMSLEEYSKFVQDEFHRLLVCEYFNEFGETKCSGIRPGGPSFKRVYNNVRFAKWG